MKRRRGSQSRLVRRGSLTVWFSPEAIEAWSPEKNGCRGGQGRYSDIAVQTARHLRLLLGLPLVRLGAAFVFFSIGMQPIENSLVARFTPDRWRATGYGLKFSVVFGIGALSVRGVQRFITHYSLAHVFVAVAGVVVALICVASLLAWRTRGRPILNAIEMIGES